MVKFNWKKKVAKALVFAMVMGTVGVHGLSLKNPVAVMAADETTTPYTAPTISYENYTATITPQTSGSFSNRKTEKYVFLEVVKDESASKILATHCYPTNGKAVVVDLSFLKPTKEQYIRVYGSDEMTKKYSDVIKISAQPAKKAIKFVPGKATINESFTGDENFEDNYEYKTLYGSTWTSFKGTTTGGTTTGGFPLATSTVAGTTIVVRKKAVEETTGSTATPGAPAGVEIKVKIAATPKAPKVSIDYAKGTVKIGKGMEIKTADSKTEEWVKVDAKAWTLDELKKKVMADCPAIKPTGEETAPKNEAFTLLVRTAATEKKAASAPAFVVIDKLDELVAPKITAGGGIGGNKTINNETEAPKHLGGEVTVKTTDTTDTRKLTYESTEKGMKLTAEGAAFEYYDSNKGTWKAVATGKPVTVALADLAVLKVRLAGVKATKDTEGAFASLEAQLPKFKIKPAKVTIIGDEECTVNDILTFTVKAVDGNKKDISPVATDVTTAEPFVAKDISTWTIPSSGVTKQNADGSYKFTAAGTYEIKVSFRGVEGSITVKVNPADAE